MAITKSEDRTRKGTATAAPIGDPAQLRVKANRRRAYAMVMNRRHNITLGNVVKDYIEKNAELSDDTRDAAVAYTSRLFSCGSESLFRNFGKGGMTYMHSMTCKHKCCHICNAERKRRLRRLYINYFKKHPELVTDYDFMHLTLTVPHSEENGWRGQKVYNKELLAAFNLMRKGSFWKRQVYAGHYAVEFTRGENGLHIHLHSLVLVKKSIGNRNTLHGDILRAWNAVTAHPTATRKEFDSKTVNALYGALGVGKSRSEKQVQEIIDSLDPTGSTMVGLESVYTIGRDGKKSYCQSGNVESLMPGIVETLKYHFEPLAFKSEDGDFDAELIVDMLPILKGQRLYGKYGEFYRDPDLRLDAIEEDDTQEVLAMAGPEVLAPDGTPADDFEYSYQVHDLAKVSVQREPTGDISNIYPTCKPKSILTGDFMNVLAQFGMRSKEVSITTNREGKLNAKESRGKYRGEYVTVIDTLTGEVMQRPKDYGWKDHWELVE